MSAIVRGNAHALPIADGAVDLIVTSPPYFGLRSYQDGGEHYDGQLGDEATPTEFVDALIECTREMVRVLKPSGSLWVNLGDKYSGAQQQNSSRQSTMSSSDYWRRSNPKAIGIPNKSLMGIPWRYALRCIDDLGLILRAEVIWSKPNGLPESVTDRVRRSHEQWFHFTVEPRYYADVDPIREPHKSARTQPRDGGAPSPWGRAGKFGDVTGERHNTGNAAGSLPGSVWSIATEPLHVPDHLGVDHFAAFPTEWPRRIIRAWSPAGGVVLDPFGGTGTTALVADALGRHGISVDMSADYCRLATWRTTDPKQRAKAAGHKPPAEQIEGQRAMFDLDIEVAS
ncbi:DNA-methyltransferase [Luteipulveratus halotolerans]|uniref:DNA-methyltransferase n=1 Tax=Luteipulveratus halotolerans TaxID=1631356 RepID=UPI0006830CE3|nr:site-specific DNA-methyltransferase [Luteipulveratus halotolerans]